MQKLGRGLNNSIEIGRESEEHLEKRGRLSQKKTMRRRFDLEVSRSRCLRPARYQAVVLGTKQHYLVPSRTDWYRGVLLGTKQ